MWKDSKSQYKAEATCLLLSVSRPHQRAKNIILDCYDRRYQRQLLGFTLERCTVTIRKAEETRPSSGSLASSVSGLANGLRHQAPFVTGTQQAWTRRNERPAVTRVSTFGSA